MNHHVLFSFDPPRHHELLADPSVNELVNLWPQARHSDEALSPKARGQLRNQAAGLQVCPCSGWVRHRLEANPSANSENRLYPPTAKQTSRPWRS